MSVSSGVAILEKRFVLGLLCCLGLLGCVHNRETAHSKVLDSLPPAVRSLPFQIVSSSEHPVLAWATAGMMERYVSYNPRVAEKLPAEVLAFALVHEYAHLELNHISGFGFDDQSPGAIRKRELEADRFAAKFWATNDAKVAQAAAEAFLSPEGRRVFGSEKNEIAAGYPSREERARAILDCLAETQ